MTALVYERTVGSEDGRRQEDGSTPASCCVACCPLPIPLLTPMALSPSSACFHMSSSAQARVKCARASMGMDEAPPRSGSGRDDHRLARSSTSYTSNRQTDPHSTDTQAHGQVHAQLSGPVYLGGH